VSCALTVIPYSRGHPPQPLYPPSTGQWRPLRAAACKFWFTCALPACSGSRQPKSPNYPSRGSVPGSRSVKGREVTMRASGSTTAFGRSLWPWARALAQFLSVKRSAQEPGSYKPFFEKRTEPAGAAPTEISFGPFRLLPTRFLLLENDKPAPPGSLALQILIVLLEQAGGLISNQELMARVWSNVFVGPANLIVHMSA
jgi:hypothetical protein